MQSSRRTIAALCAIRGPDATLFAGCTVPKFSQNCLNMTNEPTQDQDPRFFEMTISQAADPHHLASYHAAADQTLLQSALAAGLDVPNSCRNGTCRTCICELESGEIVYRIEWPGLSREEKAEGYILPCVAYPVSDVRLKWPA